MQHSLRRAGAAPPDAGAVTPPKENQPFFTLQRIPGELAREIGSEDALIIVPYGRGVVQRVEVGQDGWRRRVPRQRVAGIRGRVRRRGGLVRGPPAPRRRRAHRQGVRRQLLPQGAGHSTWR